VKTLSGTGNCASIEPPGEASLLVLAFAHDLEQKVVSKIQQISLTRCKLTEKKELLAPRGGRDEKGSKEGKD